MKFDSLTFCPQQKNLKILLKSPPPNQTNAYDQGQKFEFEIPPSKNQPICAHVLWTGPSQRAKKASFSIFSYLCKK